MIVFGGVQSQAGDHQLIQALHIMTIAMETCGSEDLLIHCLRPNQPCTTGLDQLKVLYGIVLFYSYETSEGLIQTKQMTIFDHHLGKIKVPPR